MAASVLNPFYPVQKIKHTIVKNIDLGEEGSLEQVVEISIIYPD